MVNIVISAMDFTSEFQIVTLLQEKNDCLKVVLQNGIWGLF